MLDITYKAATSFKRRYVILLMGVLGRALEAASQVDQRVQAEVRSLPDGLIAEIRLMSCGTAIALQNVGGGRLYYLGEDIPSKPQVSLMFKHPNHAFLLLSFQESTAQAFARNRIILDGDIAHALKLVRCLNCIESLILPKVIAEKAVKRYPDLSLFEKLSRARKIYQRLGINYMR